MWKHTDIYPRLASALLSCCSVALLLCCSAALLLCCSPPRLLDCSMYLCDASVVGHGFGYPAPRWPHKTTFVYIWYLSFEDPASNHHHRRNSSHTVSNMAYDCRINFGPLHSNLTAKDWKTEIDRIDVSRQTSLDGKFEYWIALVGLESRAYFQLQLPNDDDVRAIMQVTTDPRPSQSWELLAQYYETERGRYFADVYVLLRQLGFDRWMLNRGAGEPLRHGLRSWT